MQVKIDFTKTIGEIKPMHAVNRPPILGTDFSMFKYLKQAGIPFARLHDVGGVYGAFRWVDVPNIFRDFNADPYKEESYDFAFTDLLITALIENGVEPFFRLGVTIETGSAIKAYRIFPPADYQKWAIVCEHIILHYTQGWANGFNYSIRYWEIWNEPDNYEDPLENHMWRGSKEQYYEFYAVASKHLKNRFPHLKIGGYSSCGFYDLQKSFVKEANSSPRFEYFINFFDGFLDYIKNNNCPLDFFSWHSYDTIQNNLIYASYAKKRLEEAGYSHTETTLNEWNCEPNARGTYRHMALTAGMMLALQNSALDSAMFYHAEVSVGTYGGLFNPLTRQPFPAYYAFTAFNKLYQAKNQVYIDGVEQGVYALAATDGQKGYLVITNTKDQDISLDFQTGAKIEKYLLTADGFTEQEIEFNGVLPKESLLVVEFNV